MRIKKMEERVLLKKYLAKLFTLTELFKFNPEFLEK